MPLTLDGMFVLNNTFVNNTIVNKYILLTLNPLTVIVYVVVSHIEKKKKRNPLTVIVYVVVSHKRKRKKIVYSYIVLIWRTGTAALYMYILVVWCGHTILSRS